jgi:hypothetical protein
VQFDGRCRHEKINGCRAKTARVIGCAEEVPV